MTKKTPSFTLPLMFCYFLTLLLLGCGEKNAKKDTEETSTTEETAVTEAKGSNKKILFLVIALPLAMDWRSVKPFPLLSNKKLILWSWNTP